MGLHTRHGIRFAMSLAQVRGIHSKPPAQGGRVLVYPKRPRPLHILDYRYAYRIRRCGRFRAPASLGRAGVHGPGGGGGSEWAEFDASGGLHLDLYFFWSKGCPHCLRARPFVESLAARTPWLKLHSLPLADNEGNVARYLEMADLVGAEPGGVPAFLYCGTMLVGYDDDASTGAYLESTLESCRTYLLENKRLAPPELTQMSAAAVDVPFFGEIDTRNLSLPVLTLVLAALDSFNPCAFFVLLFLLSLLVHARSRLRMLAIGGIFVLISGLVYFLFMAAWLNVFLFLGQMRWITTVAGALAVLLAIINIKEYFWFKKGVSLAIPDSAKPRLYQRMRNLLVAENLFSVALGTVVLAVVANSYELLCTAGFPMVFTRALTLHALPTAAYYGYLVLYNLIYVVPLFGIVLLFVFSLGSRKLTAREGQTLKLLSGTMMLQLGAVLIAAPDALSNAVIAVVLVVISLGITALVICATAYFRRTRGPT